MEKAVESMEERCAIVKELYSKGYTVKEIAEFVGLSKERIYNALKIAGIQIKRNAIDEDNLLYADNSVEFEKVVIHGNWLYKNGKKYRVNRLCTDITPMFAPR